MFSPGILLWESISSIDINPEPNIPNQHVDRPNIHNRHRHQANNSSPSPQVSVSFSPAPQLSPTNACPLQPTLVLFNIHQVSSKFFTRRKGLPYFSNRRRICPNNLQPMPQLPEISSTNAGYFEPATRLLRGRPKYWIPAFSNDIFGSNGHFNDQNIGCLFYYRTTCAPFSIKINVTGVLTLFVLVLRLSLRIIPGKNYLNTTVFSHFPR